MGGGEKVERGGGKKEEKEGRRKRGRRKKRRRKRRKGVAKALNERQCGNTKQNCDLLCL